jgi:hypothetical protein
VAAAFAWYLAPDHHARAAAVACSRRGCPRALRRGRPGGSGRRRDRRARGQLPGDGGTALRGGRARAQLPHVGLARAPDAADRDPRPRRGPARGRRHRRGAARGLSDCDRGRG